MQNTPAPAHVPSPGRLRAVWALTIVSYVASLVVVIMTLMSAALGHAALAADPTCATLPAVTDMQATLTKQWLVGGVAALIALLCLYVAGHLSSTEAPVAPFLRRAAYVVASVALIALVISFCGYQTLAMGSCIG